MANTRLPSLPVSTDSGTVYIVKLNDMHKIGFTRKGLRRRVRDAGGELVLTIPTGQRPSVLEYAINRRFAGQETARARRPEISENGLRWMIEDLAWLRGLAAHFS